MQLIQDKCNLSLFQETAGKSNYLWLFFELLRANEYWCCTATGWCWNPSCRRATRHTVSHTWCCRCTGNWIRSVRDRQWQELIGREYMPITWPNFRHSETRHNVWWCCCLHPSFSHQFSHAVHSDGFSWVCKHPRINCCTEEGLVRAVDWQI